MPSTAISHKTKRRAMLRAQARVNPCLAANIREDIHNLTVSRRRIERMLSGDLKIPTTATEAKLRAQLGDLDAEILQLRQDLQLLQ
jgi:hypothetical protein